MANLDELYHTLGYLEGLSMKVLILPHEMGKVKSIIQTNSFFEGTIGHISTTVTDDNDADWDANWQEEYFDCTYQRNWSEEDYEEAGWDIDDLDPSHDPSQNPWIDVFGPGEDAEMAYLNHD